MTALKMVQLLMASTKPQHLDGYIIGRAGTGKTTELRHIVEWLAKEGYVVTVVAFTHKAVRVLQSKLSSNADCRTLHSFLCKRPVVNENATVPRHVDSNVTMGTDERPHLLVVDEYSMVSEGDYQDIIALQEPVEGQHTMKVLYVGDPYQLESISSKCPIFPVKPYLVQLTKVHRTSLTDILDVMTRLVQYMDNPRLAKPITSSDNIIRGVNLVQKYKASATKDKILLAWTNQGVQELNATVEGKPLPDPFDELRNVTLRHEVVMLHLVQPKDVERLVTVTGALELGTKYKTLEYLLKLPEIQFMEVDNLDEGRVDTIAFVFGHKAYRNLLDELAAEAAATNTAIKLKTGEASPAKWAKNNKAHSLARKRSKAWRKFLAIKSSVCCVDFRHAQTIHKSQGSTYKEVYLDTSDLDRCATRNFNTYLRLMYVAMSRTSSKVFTS